MILGWIWLSFFLSPSYCEYVGRNCDEPPGPDYIFDSCISYFEMTDCAIIIDNDCLQENPCFCIVEEGYEVPTQFPCETYECLWDRQKNATPTESTMTKAKKTVDSKSSNTSSIPISSADSTPRTITVTTTIASTEKVQKLQNPFVKITPSTSTFESTPSTMTVTTLQTF